MKKPMIPPAFAPLVKFLLDQMESHPLTLMVVTNAFLTWALLKK